MSLSLVGPRELFMTEVSAAQHCEKKGCIFIFLWSLFVIIWTHISSLTTIAVLAQYAFEKMHPLCFFLRIFNVSEPTVSDVPAFSHEMVRANDFCGVFPFGKHTGMIIHTVLSVAADPSQHESAFWHGLVASTVQVHRHSVVYVCRCIHFEFLINWKVVFS